MKDRIAHIIRAKNLTASDFATLLGVQPSGVSHILSGRNNPSLDFIKRIKECFPEYNLDWLIFGTGPMTGSDTRPLSSSPFKDPLPIEPEEASELDPLSTNPTPSSPAYNDLSGTLFDTIISNSPSDNQINTNASHSPQPNPIVPEMPADLLSSQAKIKSIIVLYDDGSFDSYLPRT